MFFELAKNHNIEVPETSITAIIQMFENTLDNMDELENEFKDMGFVRAHLCLLYTSRCV